MMNKQPIFSTEDLYPVATVVFLCISVMFCVLSFAFRYAETESIILMLGLGFFLAIPIVKSVGLRKSYVEIYEDGISGLTIPNKIFNGLNEMHSFELHYDEITSLSYKKDIVILSHISGTYEVQAYKCEEKVVRLIKQQKHYIVKIVNFHIVLEQNQKISHTNIEAK